MKKSIRCMAAVVLAGTAVMAFTGCSGKGTQPVGGDSKASGETVTLKMAMVDNESTNYYKGAMKIAEEVEAATDGAVRIEIAAGGTLGDERSTVELAMSGDIDMATAANSVLTNWIPEMNILDQAFLWDTADQAHAAVDGPVGTLIEEKAENLGLHVVGYMESGFRNVFSKKPIESIGDFGGVKIRTMQNEYHMAAFEAFGAMPAAIASSDQFTALQQGTIDACENAVANCLTNGFYEVTKNITYTNHAFVYIPICMSDVAWNKIPEDKREVFVEAVKRGCEAQRQYLVEANEEAVKELEDKGVVFHDIDREALKQAYEKTSQAKGWKFDPQWQSAVDSCRQQ